MGFGGRQMAYGFLTPYLERLRNEGGSDDEMRPLSWNEDRQQVAPVGILSPYMTKKGVRVPLPDEILWHVVGSINRFSPELVNGSAAAVAPQTDADAVRRLGPWG